MSRSYKKEPVIKDYNKNEKHFANKKVRKQSSIGKGGNYKKIYPQYEISDYSFRMTKQQAIAEYESWQKENSPMLEEYPTLESWLNYWEKVYKRK